MTSFSEICDRIDKSDRRYLLGSQRHQELKDLQAMREYIIMLRDNVFPNILLVCPGDKPVEAIMRDALKQLEDM